MVQATAGGRLACIALGLKRNQIGEARHDRDSSRITEVIGKEFYGFETRIGPPDPALTINFAMTIENI
jgi:hypothetical protein